MATDACLAGGRVRDKVIAGEVESTANLEEVYEYLSLVVQPTLWEQAWRKHKVLIATSGTLMAFLRTAALAWQQQEMAENAQQIADLGKILFDRLRTFSERLQEMGDGLNKAVESYTTGVNSLRLRVIPQARRFQELGAVARTEQLAEPEPVRQPTPTSE